MENEDDLKDKMDFQLPALYACEGESIFAIRQQSAS